MGIDTSELFSDQPLIDESKDQGGEFEDSQVPDNTTENAGTTDTPPEPSGESTVEPTPGERKQKVPLGALHEERTKRQERELELKQERDNNRDLQRQLAQYMIQQQQLQAPQQKVEEPPAPPSFEEDPVAAFNHLQQELQTSRKQMQDYLAGNQQQQQVQQQQVQLAQAVSAQEAAYTQTVPDYPVAADYFYQRKLAEYTAFTGNEQIAKAQLSKDYQGIAIMASNQGKNPAELMYNAAKAMGYVPGSQPKPAQQQQQQRREAPTSLSNLGGAPKAPDEKGSVGVADISDMSDAEFDKFWNEDIKGGNRNQRPKI